MSPPGEQALLDLIFSVWSRPWRSRAPWARQVRLLSCAVVHRSLFYCLLCGVELEGPVFISFPRCLEQAPPTLKSKDIADDYADCTFEPRAGPRPATAAALVNLEGCWRGAGTPCCARPPPPDQPDQRDREGLQSTRLWECFARFRLYDRVGGRHR